MKVDHDRELVSIGLTEIRVGHVEDELEGAAAGRKPGGDNDLECWSGWFGRGVVMELHANSHQGPPYGSFHVG